MNAVFTGIGINSEGTMNNAESFLQGLRIAEEADLKQEIDDYYVKAGLLKSRFKLTDDKLVYLFIDQSILEMELNDTTVTATIVIPDDHIAFLIQASKDYPEVMERLVLNSTDTPEHQEKIKDIFSVIKAKQ